MSKRTVLTLALSFAAILTGVQLASAQDRERPEGPMPPGPSPLVAALDENADGEISSAEIERAVESLKGLDENGDGKLSEKEIRPMGPPPDRGGPGPERPERLGPGQGQGGSAGAGRGDPGLFADRLKQADQDGDGKISRDEVPQRIQEIFDRIDQNADGFISEDEVRMMADRGDRGGGRRGQSDAQGGRPEGLGPRSNRRDGEGPPDGRVGPVGPGGFGPPEEFVDRLFEFDANQDGSLSRDELAKLAEQFNARGREDGPPPDGQEPRRPGRPPSDKNERN